MIQAMLSNLGILLLMHLCINTTYHLHQQKKLHDKLVTFFHIVIVSLTTITMLYFPIIKDKDLILVPLIFIAFFHGWKYTLPALLFTSLWKWLLFGSPIPDILFEIILPIVIPMLVHNKIRKDPNYILPFFIISFSWFISDFLKLGALNEFIFFHYIYLLFASFIMYFFIFTSVKHLELINKLQFYAEHDQLTGLYNMRKFEELIFLCRPADKKMFIAMIDIDKFKKINDIYGHQVGDNAIKGVASLILSCLKKKDFAGRYGGDEFIFFSMADEVEEVVFQLDSLRKTVSASPIIGSGYPISLSIGVAQLDNPAHLKEAIEQADKQLYIAKGRGRNQVC